MKEDQNTNPAPHNGEHEPSANGEHEPSDDGEPQRDDPESNDGDGPASGPTIISADEAAKLLGINRNTLYEAANDGEIPCRRIRRKFLFVREVLIAWLKHDPAA